MVSLQSIYAHNMHLSTVYSSELGPEDCGTTVNLTSVNNTIIYVNASLDTVCFECNHTQVLGLTNGVVFRVNDTVVTSKSTLGRVVKNYPHNYSDTLVVNDSSSVFNTFSNTTIQCCEEEVMVTRKTLLCHGFFMARLGVLLFKGMYLREILVGITITKLSPSFQPPIHYGGNSSY